MRLQSVMILMQQMHDNLYLKSHVIYSKNAKRNIHFKYTHIELAIWFIAATFF